MKKQVVSILLKDAPADVNKIVNEEQLRLEYLEKQELKKPHVVYMIIREWFRLKSYVK